MKTENCRVVSRHLPPFSVSHFRVVSRYLPTFSVSREDISGNDTDRNGHGPLHPQHKEWISSLLIAASTEAAVDSPKLYEPVPRMSPARESGADSIFDSLSEHKCHVVSRHLPMNVCVNVYVVSRHMPKIL